MTLDNSPLHTEVISKLTVGNHELYFTNQNQQYRIIYNGQYIVFDIPDNDFICNLFDDSKSTPNAYIWFRSKLAHCFLNLGLKRERGFLSQISSLLWEDVKKKDKQFVQAIKDAYKNKNLSKSSKFRFVKHDTRKSLKPKVKKSRKPDKKSDVYRTKKSRKKSNVSNETEHQLIAGENRSGQQYDEIPYAKDFNYSNDSITTVVRDLFPA
ncbi:5142_t:CDS:1, partial [Cetraspora pellucida]